MIDTVIDLTLLDTPLGVLCSNKYPSDVTHEYLEKIQMTSAANYFIHYMRLIDVLVTLKTSANVSILDICFKDVEQMQFST